jgi:hypothetical protein
MILKVSRYPGRLQRPFAIHQDGGFGALVYREAVRMPFQGCRNRSGDLRCRRLTPAST